MIEIKEIIKEIELDKKEKNISPIHASKIEVVKKVYKRLEEELQFLKCTGEIKEFRTLNDLAYKITGK